MKSGQKPYIAVGTPGHIDYVEAMRVEVRIAEAESLKEKPLIADNKQNDVWRKSHKRRFK